MRQFVAVAETLNFRRAAERLFMAQPPLSVAIRKLEKEIGVPLFQREGRGVRLTFAGQTALDAARRCLQDADQVSAAARSAANGESGRLRIGFVGSVTYALMPRLLRAFRRRYPNVLLELRESDNLEVLSWVENQSMDVGLVRVPTPRSGQLRFQLVERDVFCAVLRANHPLARKRTLSLQDLANEPFIGYVGSKVGGLHAAFTLVFQQAGITPCIAQEAVQVQTVISLVESAFGVALVPWVSSRYTSKNVVFRRIRDLPPGASIGVALAYHLHSETPAAKRFREIASALMPR